MQATSTTTTQQSAAGRIPLFISFITVFSVVTIIMSAATFPGVTSCSIIEGDRQAGLSTNLVAVSMCFIYVIAYLIAFIFFGIVGSNTSPTRSPKKKAVKREAGKKEKEGLAHPHPILQENLAHITPPQMRTHPPACRPPLMCENLREKFAMGWEPKEKGVGKKKALAGEASSTSLSFSFTKRGGS